MSLEEIIRQKAEAKAAEILRQEQEQKIAVAQVEHAHEEARLLDLRQSVSDIDAKIGEMHSLLAELKEAHEQAGVSVAGAKKEGKELTKAVAEIDKLFTNDEFRALLAEEGIESLDDLLQAEEYAEQEEVQSVKGLRQSRAEKRQAAREQIRARGDVKSEAHKIITAETPNVPRQRTYKDIIAALEDRMRELEAERKTVFSQTPEGQEALDKEIFDAIAKRHKRYYRNRLSKKEIHNQRTVGKDDMEDAKEYGEEKVKTALKDCYGQIIDNELAEEAKKNDQPQLQEAVETIENLPKRWLKIREILRELRGARQETINRLAVLLGNDAKAPLFQKLNWYGRYGLNDPQRLAEVFIDNAAENNSMIFFNTIQSETPEAIAERIVSEQEELLKYMKRMTIRAFPKRDIGQDPGWESQRYKSELYNPEKIAIILAEQTEFYKKFQAALTTPEEVLDKVKGNLHDEIKVKSSRDLKLEEIESFIGFDGKTYSVLRDNPLSNIKYIND